MPLKEPTKPAKRAHRATDSNHNEDEPPVKRRKVIPSTEIRSESPKSGNNDDKE